MKKMFCAVGFLIGFLLIFDMYFFGMDKLEENLFGFPVDNFYEQMAFQDDYSVCKNSEGFDVLVTSFCGDDSCSATLYDNLGYKLGSLVTLDLYPLQIDELGAMNKPDESYIKDIYDGLKTCKKTKKDWFESQLQS